MCIRDRITAALRNEQFFSLSELNAAIREKLEAYNARKFQKKECCRLSLFLGEEMPLLAPLPATPFELAEWKQATVQFNYHIAVDRMFYLSLIHIYPKRSMGSSESGYYALPERKEYHSP